jgi:hypothetical protein
VANYSFVETKGVKATFYVGDPLAKGEIIGEPQTIAQIPALGRQNVNVLWLPPSQKPITPYQIYVTLEPIAGGSQFPPSRGYGVWPPAPLECA